MQPVVSKLIWENIPITVIYTPIKSSIGNGTVISQVEVYSQKPIPIAYTGYESILFPQKRCDMLSFVDSKIRKGLEIGSVSKEWEEFQQQQQPSLF